FNVSMTGFNLHKRWPKSYMPRPCSRQFSVLYRFCQLPQELVNKVWPPAIFIASRSRSTGPFLPGAVTVRDSSETEPQSRDRFRAARLDLKVQWPSRQERHIHLSSNPTAQSGHSVPTTPANLATELARRGPLPC